MAIDEFTGDDRPSMKISQMNKACSKPNNDCMLKDLDTLIFLKHFKLHEPDSAAEEVSFDLRTVS